MINYFKITQATVALIIIFLLYACGPTAKQEEAKDTLQFGRDSFAIQPDTGLVVTKSYRQDTSKFSEDQLSALRAYNYDFNGLHMYEKADTTSVVIDVLKYGAGVKLKQPLINNQASDRLIINGFKGRMIEVDWKGRSGYVFSGYLLNYPVPRGDEHWIDYLRAHFHLKAPVYEEKRGCPDSPDCDLSYSLDKYTFEQGICFEKEGYYEGGSLSIVIPKASVQEGLLVMQALSGDMRKYFDKMPTEGYQTESEDHQLMKEVKMENGRVISISVTIGDGCSETQQVFIDEAGRVVIVAGGGC
jgi:hypothetical protein